MLDDASAACILSLIYLVINLVAAAHQLSAAFMLVDVPTATKGSEGDEWWRDPFRLFESENAPPKEQGLEGGLLDKKKSKGTDLRGGKTNLNSAAVPSSGLEKSEAINGSRKGRWRIHHK